METTHIYASQQVGKKFGIFELLGISADGGFIFFLPFFHRQLTAAGS